MLPRKSSGKVCAACLRDVYSFRHTKSSAVRPSLRPRIRNFSHQSLQTIRSSGISRSAVTAHFLSRPSTSSLCGTPKGQRHASTHSDNALREAVCNLADKITAEHDELVGALGELESLEKFPKYSSEGQDLVESIRDYQKDLEEERLLSVSEQPSTEEDSVEQTTEDQQLLDELTASLSSIDPSLSVEERRDLIAEQLGELAPETSQSEETEETEGTEETEETTGEDAGEGKSRFHPLTAVGKGGTSPSTVYPPRGAMVQPVAESLKKFSNKHIAENSRKLFGGPHLPLSTSTFKQSSQAAIPLTASQHRMSPMDGSSFLAVLYPGIYASVSNVLVEVRKRLGTEWLQKLMRKQGGARVLDAGGGGAGIMAWREVVRAEWEAMSPNRTKSFPAPYGKSTVLTGADMLRHRASDMLENTTFLPRLPNYLHVRSNTIDTDHQDTAPQRKQFDVIIAPHTLLPLEEDFERRDYVRNLWSMLNPEGGILILLEKGHVNGFEAVAGARQMILDRLISSPGATEYEDAADSTDAVQKEKGTIIAPCTNHAKCPVYAPTKEGRRPSYHCHFSQRYIRPSYLQRILGAKERDHEDVSFSYLAVQRGVDQREVQGFTQGPAASDAAFAGFDEADAPKETAPKSDEAVESALTPTPETSELSEPSIPFNPLSIPRIISPPLKRKGHVIMDMCTPAGKMERWTVPRSFSKQAFRDARKSSWGDLWALGAKTRVDRSALTKADPQDSPRTNRHKGSAAQDVDDDALDDSGLGEDGESVAHEEQAPEAREGKRVGTKVERLPAKDFGNLPKWRRKIAKKKSKKEMRRGPSPADI